MKSKFRKESSKGLPAVSTAALPDIVFMLLFFFMVAASMKTDNADSILEIDTPAATELSSVKDQNMVLNAFIGIPRTAINGSKAPILLINDKPFPRTQARDALKNYIAQKRKEVGYKNYQKVEVQLRAHKLATDLGFINEVKDVLSQENIKYMYYAASEGDVYRNFK